MNLTVPMQRGGAKSLPAELKARSGRAPLKRFRMTHPGYMGMGDDSTDGSGLDFGTGVDTSIPIDTSGGSIISPPVVIPIDYATPAQMAADLSNAQAQLAAQGFNSADATAALAASLGSGIPASYSGPLVIAPGSSAPAAPNGYQWAQLLDQSGKTISMVLAASKPGTSYQTLPNGSTLVYSQAAGYPVGVGAGAGLSINSSGLSASLSGMMPLLLIGLVGYMLVSSGGGRR